MIKEHEPLDNRIVAFMERYPRPRYTDILTAVGGPPALVRAKLRLLGYRERVEVRDGIQHVYYVRADAEEIEREEQTRAATERMRVERERFPKGESSITLPTSGFETLAEAQEYVRIKSQDGVHCPCCSQYVRVYSRSMYAEMARWLVLLVREHERTGDWVHAADTGARGGDYAKLKAWKLVEQDINVDTNKAASGRWRPTREGIDFVHGRTKVRKKALFFDAKVMGFEGPEVSIIDALGKKFNYAELMAGTGGIS